MKADVIKTMHETEVATLRLPNHSEHCITVQSGGDPDIMLRSAAQIRKAVILGQVVFAGNRLYSEFISKGTEWPVTWLQGDACTDGILHSVQAVALSGMSPKPVRSGGRNIGFIYEDACARYCRLCGLLPADLTAARGGQARSAFETAADILVQNGFSFTDTVRTWIYLDHLLEWYDDFNTVRTAFFNETGVFDHIVPASTGIGAGNPFGAAITMDFFAVQPKSVECTVRTVASPLQNPALDYNSSFSRAVELASPTHRRLLISGTASIAPDGKTVHQNEPEKQIRLTLDAVKAILESRGMHWNDLFRGIAYFKNMAYLPLYRRVASELHIPHFPLAVSHADVCRHDLCFEIEVDAAQTCLA
ncbi:MAG TPA: RidA family protein [Acidobacteriota bacterium]|nr:RidA family protein [Acidobacteriota bacterium]